MEKMVIVIGEDGRVADIISSDHKLVVIAYQNRGAIDETELGHLDGQPVQVAPRLVDGNAARCARALLDVGVSSGDIAA